VKWAVAELGVDCSAVQKHVCKGEVDCKVGQTDCAFSLCIESKSPSAAVLEQAALVFPCQQQSLDTGINMGNGPSSLHQAALAGEINQVRLAIQERPDSIDATEPT
jgi:hypothetical protein